MTASRVIGSVALTSNRKLRIAMPARRENQADPSADENRDHCLADHESANRSSRGAERDSDGDLLAAFCDAVRDDGIDAGGRKSEGEGREECERNRAGQSRRGDCRVGFLEGRYCVDRLFVSLSDSFRCDLTNRVVKASERVDQRGPRSSPFPSDSRPVG